MQELENQFISSGGSFKEYKIGELFEVEGTRSLDEGKLSFLNEGVNFVGRVNDNNGVKGKIAKQNFEPNLPNTITVTVIGNYKYVKFQEKPYYCSQNINKLTPYFRINKNIALYFATHIQRFVSTYDGQQGGYKLNELSEHKIFIPTKNSQPDFDFMEEYIHVLEKERIHVLEVYLHMSGLDSYSLTSEDATVLNNFRFGNMVFKEYKIGELFEKQILKFRKKKFDKNLDISKEANSEFNLPLVNAKDGNNGIMYYGRSSDFDSVEMSIDIVNDGAISTGNVYAQPQRTGVLYNAYLIKSKMNFNLSAEQLLYFARSIEKSIKKKFGYDNKASWEKVKEENIYLPVNQQYEIDYEFMERYIRAIEKKVIKNVVDWKDKEIERTKDVVSSVS